MNNFFSRGSCIFFVLFSEKIEKKTTHLLIPVDSVRLTDRLPRD
jgi:hypothetical protein